MNPDVTLNKASRRHKKDQARNGRAWNFHMENSNHCRYCGHHRTSHLMRSAQPHFYRPSTTQERADPRIKLYWAATETTDHQLAKRITVTRSVDLERLFCERCAREIGTKQVTCFLRTTAIGELVGTNPAR